MATVTPNFGWDVPQSTDLVKDGATAIAALGNDIDTSLVDLKGGTTGQVLSKASNTDMDFTWVAQDDSNAIQNSIVNAKGDLISASANDTPAILSVGTNNQVLMADSSTATGLKWGTPSSGGYTLISSQQPSAVSSLSLSSIPSTYKHLVLTWEGVFHSAGSTAFGLRFNNDSTSARYTNTGFVCQGSVSFAMSWGTSIWSSQPPFGEGVTDTNIAYRNCGSLIIYDYANTTLKKNYWINFSFMRSDSTFFGGTGTGVFDTNTAVSSIDIVRLYGTATLSTAANCSIDLYGVN